MTMTLLRGRLLSFKRAPQSFADADSYFYESDGGLLIEDGRIVARGSYSEIRAEAPEVSTRLRVIRSLRTPKVRNWRHMAGRLR